MDPLILKALELLIAPAIQAIMTKRARIDAGTLTEAQALAEIEELRGQILPFVDPLGDSDGGVDDGTRTTPGGGG